MRRWGSRDAKRVDRTKLNELFKRLRGEGYVARQAFSCCGSCAGYDLGSEFGEKRDAGKWADVKGCVFYHKQDADNLREHGSFMLRFGQLSHWASPGKNAAGENLPSVVKYSSTEDTLTIGWRIVGLCQELGIKVDWNGEESQCIEVDLR